MTNFEKGRHCIKCHETLSNSRRYCAFCVLKWLTKRLAILALFLLIGGRAYASPEIRAVLGEAEGESYKGKVAVSEVMRARQKARLKGGIYGLGAVTEKGGHYYRGKRRISSEIVKQAEKAWKESAASNYTLGATHFENIRAFGRPKWSKGMRETVTIGSHTFFKPTTRR